MSAKRNKSDPARPSGAVEAQISLLDVLPESVLAVIAKFSSPGRWAYPKGHPMVAVATSFRDAVFRSLSRLELDLRRSAEQKTVRPAVRPNHRAVAQLLHRACCEAASGLKVELGLDTKHEALPILLQPALGSGGWRKVHKLEVGAILSAYSCGGPNLLFCR
jgi:hypothetical protein